MNDTDFPSVLQIILNGILVGGNCRESYGFSLRELVIVKRMGDFDGWGRKVGVDIDGIGIPEEFGIGNGQSGFIHSFGTIGMNWIGVVADGSIIAKIPLE